MSTTRTAAGHGDGSTDSSSSASRWSELPDDLVGMVRLRISSIRDRVRLATVYRPWRAAASRLPVPPAAPLLLLSPRGRSRKKHLCGPDGSWALRIPNKAVGKRFVGSHQGGWIASSDSADRTLVIVNLFSGAEVLLTLTSKQCTVASASCVVLGRGLHKVIFSQDPNSPNGCTLAGFSDDRFGIALCRVGCSGSAWSEKVLYGGSIISDIAFCNGELYGLTRYIYNEMLIKFEISTAEDGTPVVTAVNQMAVQRHDGPLIDPDHTCHMVEWNGQLLMAVRSRWLQNREPFLRVLKLVDAKDNEAAYKHKWAEVTSLGDYALFLGPTGSRTMHVPVGECRGMKRNHIYYSCPTWSAENKIPDDAVYSVMSDDGERMYCREDQCIGDGVGRTGYYMMGYCNSAVWLHPPDF